MEFKIQRESELRSAAEKILNSTDSRIFTFSGDLGAGKTTFIKYFLSAFGSSDEVTSPTFALVNEYLDTEKISVYHFDFYRIKSPEEAMDIGFEEYIDSGSYCFIEWPEKILKLLSQKYVSIQIKAEDQSRIIKVNLP